MKRVYFVLAEGLDLVKIGTSGDFRSRLEGLAADCPVKLTLLATMRGGLDQEAEIHLRFQASRHHNEWFHLTPDLAEFIAGLRENPEPLNSGFVSVEDDGLLLKTTPAQFFRWMEFLFGPEWLNQRGIASSGPELRRWWEDAQKGICSITPLGLRHLMQAHRQKFSRINAGPSRPVTIRMSPNGDIDYAIG